MSRLLCQLSYTAAKAPSPPGRCLFRAPIRNRTVDLLLTMETLCRLSYWGTRGTRIHGLGGRTRTSAGQTTVRLPGGPQSVAFPPRIDGLDEGVGDASSAGEPVSVGDDE